MQVKGKEGEKGEQMARVGEVDQSLNSENKSRNSDREIFAAA